MSTRPNGRAGCRRTYPTELLGRAGSLARCASLWCKIPHQSLPGKGIAMQSEIAEGELPAERLRFETKGEAIYAVLRRGVLDGSLPPGSFLKQESLAQTFGTSVTPLREALRRLEGERLVEVHPDKTVWVASLSVLELEDLRQVRWRMDPLAASLAAARATPTEGEHLLALSAFTMGPDALAWHQLHNRFHRRIHELAGNAVLSAILNDIWDRLGRYRIVRFTEGDNRLASSGVTHLDLALAISEGAPDPGRGSDGSAPGEGTDRRK